MVVVAGNDNVEHNYLLYSAIHLILSC